MWFFIGMIFLGILSLEFFNKKEKQGCSALSWILLAISAILFIISGDFVGFLIVIPVILGIIGVIGFLMYLFGD